MHGSLVAEQVEAYPLEASQAEGPAQPQVEVAVVEVEAVPQGYRQSPHSGQSICCDSARCGCSSGCGHWYYSYP